MFPIAKKVIVVDQDTQSKSFDNIVEIPRGKTHPGSFGYVRKNHIHEGVDIYCEFNDEVLTCEDGEVIKIIPFTGEIVGTPWWNNTYAVLVKHKECFINYGEIVPTKDLFVGKQVKKGEVLGNITPVLKVNKGRPMNMLHLEMYDIKSDIDVIPVVEWKLNTEQPRFLLDPTQYLIENI